MLKQLRFQRLYNFAKFAHAQRNMSMSVKEISQGLQSFAPLNLAETWDNVGLLVDPMSDSPVKTILLTNDLTEDIVEEAKKLDAKFIVTYHPNIFQGLKTISANTWKERIIVQCIKNNIAVFSPHTSWDCIHGGVNDWLSSAFQFKSTNPIKFNIETPNQGAGRVLILQEPISVQNAVNLVKKHIGVNHIRLALGRNKTMDALIGSVALCAGSGGSVLRGVEADLYLTGEMSHHEVLDATQNGVHVILCEHSNSERGFLEHFRKILKEKILDPEMNVVISGIDKDPLIVV